MYNISGSRKSEFSKHQKHFVFLDFDSTGIETFINNKSLQSDESLIKLMFNIIGGYKMKKILIFVLFAALLIATTSVHALEFKSLISDAVSRSFTQKDISQAVSFTVSDLELGSNDQRRKQTATANLKITNTGSDDITVALSSNAASLYALQFSQNNINVPSNQSVDVSVSVTVPDDQDSGRKSIGTITAAASGVTRTSNIYLTTKSELVISRVKVNVDGKSSSLDDGEDVDAEPGDEVILTVTLKNEYDESIDIEDITLTVESDSDLDLDDDADISRIKDNDKDDSEFSFTIPRDIDEDDYDIDITVDGEDENGANHEDDYTITINIDKKSHEISIVRTTLSPSRISCGGRVSLKTLVENTGNNDEDNVAIEIINSELNLEEYFTGLNIDEADDIEKTLTFNVPSSIEAGNYNIEVTSYYDNKQSDVSVVTLYVDTCAATNNTSAPTTPTPPVVYPTGTSAPSYGTQGFMNTTGYIVLLGIAALVFIIIIIVLLVKFVF